MIAGPIEIRPIASHPITACLVTAQVNSSHHKNSFNFEAFLRLLGETIHSPHTEERTCWCLSSQVHRANRGSLAGKKLSSWSLKHTYTHREKLGSDRPGDSPSAGKHSLHKVEVWCLDREPQLGSFASSPLFRKRSRLPMFGYYLRLQLIPAPPPTGES